MFYKGIRIVIPIRIPGGAPGKVRLDGAVDRKWKTREDGEEHFEWGGDQVSVRSAPKSFGESSAGQGWAELRQRFSRTELLVIGGYLQGKNIK